MVAVPVKERQEVQFVALNLPDGGFSDDQFFEFCQLNKELKIEKLATGEIIIMSLTGGKTGIRNSELTTEFGIWNRKQRKGRVFDSSTGFKIPNGAVYSPDVAWLPNERWNSLLDKQQEKFVPLCPDFICELASSKKQVSSLKSKLEEYMDNGCRLGWLIDPYKKVTHVYLPDQPSKEVQFNDLLNGLHVLEGFELKMEDLWDL